MTKSQEMLAAIDQQDLVAAERYLQEALLTDDEDTLLALGQYLESIGFYPQAKVVYLKIKSSFPELAINLAQIASEDGQVEQAFLYLDEIAADSPAYLEALLVMADLYDAEGLTDVAREKLLLASQLSDDPLLVFGLAEIELALDNYQSAIDYYAQLDYADILEMTRVSIYERIGLAYAALGKFEAAIQFLEKAVELDFDEATVFELASLLYEQEQYQKANSYFKQIDSLNPDFFGYEYPYALSLHAEHETKEALRLLQAGLSKNSFDSQLLLLASQLSYELHDRKAAEDYLLRALQVAEDDEEVLMRLTNLYLEQEDFEQLVALDREEIDHVLTRWNLAKAYAQLEQDEQALQKFASLASDLADNPEFLADYIYFLREIGQAQQARPLLDRYLQLVPDDGAMLALQENW